MIPKKMFSNKFLVPGFTIILGLVLVVFAVTRVVQTESFMKGSKQASGTVLESNHGFLFWSAEIMVEYRDREGSTWRATFEPGRERATRKKGDTVTLLYDPAETSRVYIGNPRLRRYPVAGTYFILGLGLIFLILRQLREGTRWK